MWEYSGLRRLVRVFKTSFSFFGLSLGAYQDGNEGVYPQPRPC